MKNFQKTGKKVSNPIKKKSQSTIKTKTPGAQTILSNQYGIDGTLPENAVEFNRRFLGLSGNGMGGDGMFVGEGIFNMDLPMHKSGEVPDFSNPYGQNMFARGRGQVNPRSNPVQFLQNFFGGFGIEFPVKEIMQQPIRGRGVDIRRGNIGQRNSQRNNNANNNGSNIGNKKNNSNKSNNANNNINNINKNNKSISNNINNNINNNRGQIRLENIRRHNFDSNEIFDPSFLELGGRNDDIFRDNYASNFRSNLEKEVFEYLLGIIRGNRGIASDGYKPPIKQEILKKLNKFDMNEKYMKKNIENGNLEAPFCCICLAEIKLKQKAVLLPCGHLLHWKCAELWLKKNNTCPMCRFELNEYFANKKK